MSDPLLLSGPAFLLFYLMFAALVCVILRERIKRVEMRGKRAPLEMASDPYLIAYLRGGAHEAVKVATISMVDRSLLHFEGGKLRASSPNGVRLVQREIERELLTHYQAPGAPGAMLAGASGLRSCIQYQKQLEESGLLVSAGSHSERRAPVVIALIALIGVGALKIMVALAHGHYNIGFLIVLCLLASIYPIWQLRRRGNWRGEAQLQDLRTLFGRLKSRAHRLPAGGASNEMALLAAVFGMDVLPATLFPFVKQLYPLPKSKDSDSDSSSSSDSSCSSSSDGGSSCGGGSGCGGCGS
ncbi:uncharacterized protein (TIGR04222 family) [Oxalobacteraceae bacterium GrIS 1.11]